MEDVKPLWVIYHHKQDTHTHKKKKAAGYFWVPSQASTDLGEILEMMQTLNVFKWKKFSAVERQMVDCES